MTKPGPCNGCGATALLVRRCVDDGTWHCVGCSLSWTKCHCWDDWVIPTREAQAVVREVLHDA